jgi:hypothetical protein
MNKIKEMKIINELKKRKIPIVKIDKSLNKFDDKILFPEKLAKANEMLKKVGLPKQWTTK